MFKTQNSEKNGYMCFKTELRGLIGWTTQSKRYLYCLTIERYTFAYKLRC